MTMKKIRIPEEPKTNQYRIRLSDKEVEKIDYCCEVLHITKAEVLRRGLEKVYDEVKEENEQK